MHVSKECKHSSFTDVLNLFFAIFVLLKERSTFATPIGNVQIYRCTLVSRGANLRPICYKIPEKLCGIP